MPLSQQRRLNKQLEERLHKMQPLLKSIRTFDQQIQAGKIDVSKAVPPGFERANEIATRHVAGVFASGGGPLKRFSKEAAHSFMNEFRRHGNVDKSVEQALTAARALDEFMKYAKHANPPVPRKKK